MQLAITYLRDTPQQNYLFEVCRATGMEWSARSRSPVMATAARKHTDWRFVAPVPVSGPGIPAAVSSDDLVLPNDQVHVIIVDRVPPAIETVVSHDPTTSASR